MAGQVYRKSEEEILASNVQTQKAAEQQKTQTMLAHLRPVVQNTDEQLRIKTQMIVLETYKALERGIPPGSSLKTLLG